MGVYFENFEQTGIVNFVNAKNTDLEMEIENSGLEDCKLDFAGLKIENFQYLDFGHMVNMDLETDMDIEYSEIGNFMGLKQNNYLDSFWITKIKT